jgi:FkbH-like protein
VLRPQHVFPVLAHWNPKSESIDGILRAWNVGADSIVFVDDSPMELAEVGARHPEVECLLFPKDDPAAVVELLHRLRDLFGKSELREEDRLRLESLRAGAAVAALTATAADGTEAFLAGVEAELTLDFAKDPLDTRALELLNKTNQFNLNGRRYTEAEWLRHLDRADSFVLTASYRDRFGPLGKVAVLTGTVAGDTVHVDGWVMSCRAFARRIEHQCLRALYERFGAAVVTLDFVRTERNGPAREFLETFLGADAWPSAPRLAHDAFEARCPPTHHTLRHPEHARTDG